MSQNQAAWITKPKGNPLEVKEAPYPSPSDYEVVIKNHAVAINPVDGMMQEQGEFIEKYPTVFGCDVAGVVAEVGSKVETFQKGDRVIGNAASLSLGLRYAAFQAYVLCPANVVCKLPNQISFERGSVLPLAVNTAALALFAHDTVALTPRPSVAPKPSEKFVFIYGGSGSVGGTAIQLAKAAGANVVTTASKRNHEYCKSLGADTVFDYNDTDWIERASAVFQGKHLAGAFDSISKPDTLKATAQVRDKAGSSSPIATVLPSKEGEDFRFVFGTKLTLDQSLAQSIWSDFLPLALAKGSFQAKPDPLIVGDGLESIQKAIDIQRKGVSAQKVVVTIR